jgi:hypothetical protein
MSRRLCVVYSMTVLALVACSEVRSPPPQERPTTPPVGSAPPAAAVAGDALGQAIRAALGGDYEAHYFVATSDLNGDGAPEPIAYVAGPMVCGTGGCPVFVFKSAADGYRLVSRITVARPPVRLGSGSSMGWRNIVVGVGGGGMAAGNAELKFDGTGYPTNPTVPPAEPLTNLADSEVLIAEFGSFKDGKPVPAQAYGDVKLPVAGEVLGTPIHTQDAEELRYFVLKKLTDRYAAEKGIAVTAAETAAYIQHMRAVLSKDRNFTGPLPGSEESAADKAARQEIAAAFIRQWKINRALYQQYGGRIIFQQGGPEPLDAYRAFLEDSAARGSFRIQNKNLEAAFWRYYRDDSIHSFYKPGSAEATKAFANPPWLAN